MRALEQEFNAELPDEDRDALRRVASCFTATAETGTALLFKGDDFGHTDLSAAPY